MLICIHSTNWSILDIPAIAIVLSHPIMYNLTLWLSEANNNRCTHRAHQRTALHSRLIRAQMQSMLGLVLPHLHTFWVQRFNRITPRHTTHLVGVTYPYSLLYSFILSYFIVSYLILSNLILSYLILSSVSYSISPAIYTWWFSSYPTTSNENH